MLLFSEYAPGSAWARVYVDLPGSLHGYLTSPLLLALDENAGCGCSTPQTFVRTAFTGTGGKPGTGNEWICGPPSSSAGSSALSLAAAVLSLPSRSSVANIYLLEAMLPHALPILTCN